MKKKRKAKEQRLKGAGNKKKISKNI